MEGVVKNPGIPSRGLRSAEELGAHRAHGERLRYMAGCRCFYCRRASSDYERQRGIARRNGDWNGIVDATKARQHMLELRRQGVGRRAVQASTDVANSVLSEIVTGRKRRIRARTERLILAVTIQQAADGAHVNAHRTWVQIHQLLGQGFTKARISAEIGQAGRALQLGRTRVTVRNAEAINRLWARYMTISGVAAP